MKIRCPRCSQPLQSAGSVEESTFEYATLSLCSHCGFGLDLRWRGRGSARARPTPDVILVTQLEGLSAQLDPMLPVELESTDSTLDALGTLARALSLGSQVHALIITHCSRAHSWSEFALSVRSLEEGFSVPHPVLICIVTSEPPTTQDRQEIEQLNNIYWIPCEPGEESASVLSMAPQLFPS